MVSTGSTRFRIVFLGSLLVPKNDVLVAIAAGMDVAPLARRLPPKAAVQSRPMPVRAIRAASITTGSAIRGLASAQSVAVVGSA